MSDRNKVFEKQLLREKLLTALESGRYKQVGSILFLDGGMCFLGVAYDISDTGCWRYTDAFGQKDYHIDGRRCGVYSLSTKAAAKYGFKRSATAFLRKKNDDDGWTFAQIAAEIRANPQKYFKD
jgi:hypothetical protein